MVLRKTLAVSVVGAKATRRATAMSLRDLNSHDFNLGQLGRPLL
jgi:hypothetical protein